MILKKIINFPSVKSEPIPFNLPSQLAIIVVHDTTALSAPSLTRLRPVSGRPTPGQRRANAGPTPGQRRANAGPTPGQRRANAG